jgi:hypothetical protein
MRPGAGIAGIKVHARPTRTPPPTIPTLQRIPLVERKSHLQNIIADEVERWAQWHWKMEALNGYKRSDTRKASLGQGISIAKVLEEDKISRKV